MKKFCVLISVITLIFFSCSDGNVLEFELDFDQELGLCGDIYSEDYLVYDIKTDPNESLMLLFSGSDTNDKIFFPTETPYEEELTINGSSTRFNYRFYDGDPLEIICQGIPSSEVNITEDYEAQSGTIKSITTYEDLDGIRTVTVFIEVVNTDIEILTADNITIGTYTHSYSLDN
ncbi:MAG: hypothetical protein KJN82_06765 [Bacteroidia bacterium]|nr:hypothetical protein [Bacteroidia bacterium]